MDDKGIFRAVFLAMLAVLGLIFTCFLIWVTRSLVTPTIAALLTAYMLYPLMHYSSKLGIPRWLTVIIIMTLIGAMISITVSYFVPIVTEEVRELQASHSNIRAGGTSLEGVVATDEPELAPIPSEQKSSTLLTIVQDVSRELKGLGLITKEWDPEKSRAALNTWLANYGNELLSTVGLKAIQLGNFLMIFAFVLIFGLLDGDKFYKTLVSFMPNSLFEAGIYIVNSTTRMFGAYIRGVAIETVILGAICLILMVPLMIIIKPLSLVISLLIVAIISLTNIVRIVGPIFGAVGGAVIAFSTTSDIRALFGVLVVALIVQLFDNVLVLPLVMEGQMELHPVLCLLGVLAGGILGGVLGMILAIPVLGGVKVLLQVLSVELHKFNYGSKAFYVYGRGRR